MRLFRVLWQKVVKPSLRKQMAHEALKQYPISIHLAYTVFCIGEPCYCYQPKLIDDNVVIAD